MNSTKVIALFALALGAVLLGPVWTMTTPPETFVGSYAYGVTDAFLVSYGILMLYIGCLNISKRHDVVG